MTSEEKLSHVEKQLSVTWPVDELDCPYCGQKSLAGKMFCCETLMKAVQAILDRQASEALLEDAAKIHAKIRMN